MKHFGNRVEDLKIAYIGGGSRGWAWGLMSDLSQSKEISGDVYLYDIDFQAAKDNETIGNKFGDNFKYKAVLTIKEALLGADFVIISILPGTFDEMESDVHAPEKYGIYQSVGDSTGPGGLIRALRTMPMYVEIAERIKEYSPEAWVINYTNPMALCVATLYKVFPRIKAFGCCHEVFGTQKVLCHMLDEMGVAKKPDRHELATTPVGINHFTWLTSAYYKNTDLFPLYKEFVKAHKQEGIFKADQNWMNNFFSSAEMVKFELFEKFGVIAAAGDRHLAEFCPGSWFLESPDVANSWKFNLTPVSWRKEDLLTRKETSRKIVSGEINFEYKPTGEEGVNQICALLGLSDMVTNVNLPNQGQIENIPLGTIVETNAIFSGNSVVPVHSGKIPENVYSIMATAVYNQNNILNGFFNKDMDLLFNAFVTDRLTDKLSLADARELFHTMLKNTSKYLPDWIVRTVV
ncbi:MAG TPA: alpha-glucosidase/alpha-galactosidase [Clostridiales bacterium]|nr:alpha-glucosidase/alpha-galactosidase [Clostridiales bacterium]